MTRQKVKGIKGHAGRLAAGFAEKLQKMQVQKQKVTKATYL